MDKPIKTQACPSCGGTMFLEEREDFVVYRDRKKAVETVGFWCRDCGEAVLDGKAMACREGAFLELRAEVDEVLGPTEVAQIREKIRLSQRAAGELLGGGPRAFQKYESGKQAVSVPMSNLLRLLGNDPSRIEELQALSRARDAGKKEEGVPQGRGWTVQTEGRPIAVAEGQVGKAAVSDAKNIHVVPHEEGWAVQHAGGERAIAVKETQAEAIARAREIAQREGGEVSIHGKDGKKRDKDSYGNDPCPPKDKK